MAQPLYFVECSYGKRLGNAFRETDRDQNSREAIIDLIRSGEITPVKILEVCEDEGTCRDVTDDLLSAANEGHIADVMTGEDLAAAFFDHARDLRKHQVA